MSTFVTLTYALVCYAVFVGTLVYAVGFTGNFAVPKTIDDGTVGPLVEALVVNSILLGVFAAQHSVMARRQFKHWWTRIVPPGAERSTYVLAASIALALLFWQWRPISEVVWKIDAPLGIVLMRLLFWLGWTIAVVSTFLIDHAALFGVSEVVARATKRSRSATQFGTPMFYRYVRHPLYAGIVLAFWAAPTMTYGHLLFAVGATLYVFVGIWFEERDLIHQFGDRYRTYRQRVGMLVPRAGSSAWARTK